MDTVEILQNAGFDVREASNADQALRKLNGGGYELDVLVTDVQMPGSTNGYGLAKQVRDRFPRAAIVIISGVARPSLAEMTLGASFLAKPVTPERLLGAINDALLRA